MIEDKQQYLVYEWEREYVYILEREFMSSEECREYIDRLCKDYNIKPLGVKISFKKNITYFEPRKWRIVIGENGRSRQVLLHEFGHVIDLLTTGGIEHHGPSFVRIVMELYNKYLEIPFEYLYSKANKMGVSYLSREDLKNKRIKRY